MASRASAQEAPTDLLQYCGCYSLQKKTMASHRSDAAHGDGVNTGRSGPSDQLGETKELMRNASAGLASPDRRRGDRRESPASYPKQPTTRSNVQVNGRLGGHRRRSASSDGACDPRSLLGFLQRCLSGPHDGESDRSSRGGDHPFFSVRGRKLLKRRPLR